MTSPNSTDREIAVSLMRQGLATAAEIATALNISRQLARYWANSVDIDPMATRAARVQQLVTSMRRGK